MNEIRRPFKMGRSYKAHTHKVTTQPKTSGEILYEHCESIEHMHRMKGFVDWNRSQNSKGSNRELVHSILTSIQTIQLYRHFTEPQLIFGLQIQCSSIRIVQFFFFFFSEINKNKTTLKRSSKYLYHRANDC